MSKTNLEQINRVKIAGGWQETYTHKSQNCHCTMRFSVYLPPQVENSPGQPFPVLYWLSGLTCNDENFMTKAGAQRYAAEHGIILVAPDTSPRGENVPDDPEQAWDFGLGAGFYLDATQSPWNKHYQMYSYIVEELPQLIEAHFPANPQRRSISGHSMGGHGALTIALKNPGKYRSVSAFAPICAPLECPWGKKAFQNYLGEESEEWKNYDASYLVQNSRSEEQLHLFIDQGEADGFLKEQLLPEKLEAACQKVEHPLTLRLHPGYDHSYYFIASFIGEHIAHHAKHLMG